MNRSKLYLHNAVCVLAAGAVVASMLAAVGCGQRSTHTANSSEAEQMPYEERLSLAMRALDRGRNFQDRGNLEAAEAEFKNSLELLPDLGAAWNNLGLIYMTQDRTLEADAAFRAAADAMPTDPRPLVNLGILLHRRGHATQARTAFLNALQRDPNHVEALRGAYVADVALRTTDEEMLDRVSRALLIERDPVWLEKYRYEKLRIEQALREKVLEYR
ncbi:MAG: tetratricopeptide repeat protein [Phycisphaeraceae bacterium]|nr:tetratricopeptide repeat protein [Phycisphaerales bacterium]MCB9859941.1 tetratricopeptide repeat protein [Phycisphaeraceae bacterium]